MTTNSTPRRRFDWLSRMPFLLIWIPAIGAILYLKFVSMQLTQQFGFDFRALSLINKLSIFRVDIFFCFLLVPLGLTLVALLLPRRLSGLVVTVFSVFCICISYAEVK